MDPRTWFRAILVFHVNPNEGRSTEEGAVGRAVHDCVLVLGLSVKLSKWVCVCMKVYVYMCVYLYYCYNISTWPALKWTGIHANLTYETFKKVFWKWQCNRKVKNRKKNTRWPSFSKSFPSSSWTFSKISFGIVPIIRYPGANKTYIASSIRRKRGQRAYGSETSSVFIQEVWASFMPPPCPVAEERPGLESRSGKAAQGPRAPDV